ncbi:alpha/beta hydrolase [Pseudomonas hormoni]|uniref:Alpha/beta hydrolase n=1 Tax=Pseudomonas hormoni TaxID=3093767 RepID=A0ABX8F303_9PSED|nr:alpha/beta hydrolase [Pseudomonas hormoni]QVW25282.1 alpha/beta hydrolase [Pseudomonas hormoni]
MNRSELPTLVLLPGMDGTGQLFSPLVSALRPDIETIVVRYPCDIALSYEELEAIARKSLPTDRPFILLGESFSGPIAISLTALHLPQQTGLILCSTFIKNPRPVFKSLKRLITLLPIELFPTRWLSKILLGRFSTASLRAALNEAITQVTPSVMRSRLRSVVEVDVSVQLAGLDIATLYLRASQDWVVPQTASIRVLEANPKVLEVVLDAPHCLLQASATEAARAIRHFMESVSPAVE